MLLYRRRFFRGKVKAFSIFDAAVGGSTEATVPVMFAKLLETLHAKGVLTDPEVLRIIDQGYSLTPPKNQET